MVLDVMTAFVVTASVVVIVLAGFVLLDEFRLWRARRAHRNGGRPRW